MSLTAHLLHAIKHSLSQSSQATLVTIVAVKGSAPRGVGTSMLVLPTSIVATIGGGRLEHVAIKTARAAVAQAPCHNVRERFALGDRLGQCCGGSVELLFEPVQPNWQSWVNAGIQALQNGVSYERCVDEHYTHVIAPLSQRLILCGAGHVGRALVRVLAEAPISIHWLDERCEEFPEQVPSNVLCEITDTAAAVVSSAAAGSAVLITTHRHDLDFELAAVGLAQPQLAYCGMIGSGSKRARFERQWRQHYSNEKNDAPDAALARLVCPIGGTALGGKEPEIVAIAAAYEILNALQTWRAPTSIS